MLFRSMDNPKNILLKRDELNLEQIKQYKVYVKFDEYKYSTLVDLYKNLLIGQCIIFVNSVNSADELGNKLEADGYAIGKIHGSLDTQTRMEVLKNFRIGLIRVLIATDVLSRGIDIEQIGIVINYDIPRDRSQYIHRIGRSGRFGKVGVAINFVTDRDYKNINDIHSSMYIKPVNFLNSLEQYLYVTPNKMIRNIPESYNNFITNDELYPNISEYAKRILDGDTNILDGYDIKTINKTNIIGFQRNNFEIFYNNIIKLRTSSL